MRAARFVTLCFTYSGLILLAQYVTTHGISFEVAGFFTLLVGLTILTVGVIRLRNPDREKQNPAEYGFLAYGLGILSAALTVIFLGQLLYL